MILNSEKLPHILTGVLETVKPFYPTPPRWKWIFFKRVAVGGVGARVFPFPFPSLSSLTHTSQWNVNSPQKSNRSFFAVEVRQRVVAFRDVWLYVWYTTVEEKGKLHVKTEWVIILFCERFWRFRKRGQICPGRFVLHKQMFCLELNFSWTLIVRKEYSLDELKQKPPPEGVDPSRLESYLNEDDFQVKRNDCVLLSVCLLCVYIDFFAHQSVSQSLVQFVIAVKYFP